MHTDERERVADRIGREVRSVRTLAGGFSHETVLIETSGEPVVARFGGPDPVVEAAVMRTAGACVPVPEVLHVEPAGGGRTRAMMLLEHVAGTTLEEVLNRAAGGPSNADGPEAMRELGAEVGRVAAGVAAVSFGAPGFFDGPELSVPAMPPWSRQLPEFAASCMDNVPDGRLDGADRRAWAALCERHAPALTVVDDVARLVHADLNPKNLLVDRTLDGRWRVAAVLDWEFAFAGCPYADPGNMARFGRDYPEGFLTGFAGAYAEALPAGLPGRKPWAYIARVLDMFALSDLVTRPAGHPVADAAAGVIRAWTAGGVPERLASPAG